MRYRLLVLLTLALPPLLSACSENAPPPAPYAVEEAPLSQISADLAAGKLLDCCGISRAFNEPNACPRSVRAQPPVLVGADPT